MLLLNLSFGPNENARELAPSVATGAAPAVWCSPDLGNVYLKGQNHHAEQHLECCSSCCCACINKLKFFNPCRFKLLKRDAQCCTFPCGVSKKRRPWLLRFPHPLRLLLQVLSQRRSWIHRLLSYEDEVLACVSLLLDWHSLHTSDATFAESLYGLCRRQIPRAHAPARAAPQPDGHGISEQQRRLGLLLEVGM